MSERVREDAEASRPTWSIGDMVRTYWPILAAAATIVWAGGHAEGKLNDHEARLDRLEQTLPSIRDDLAAIKQQGKDTTDRLDRMESQLDDSEKKDHGS